MFITLKYIEIENSQQNIYQKHSQRVACPCVIFETKVYSGTKKKDNNTDKLHNNSIQKESK